MKKLLFIISLMLLMAGQAFALSEPGGPCCQNINCVKYNGAHLECKYSSYDASDPSKCNLAKGAGTGICVIPGKESVRPSSSFRSLEGIINTVVDYAFYLAVIACPLVIAIGAFLFLTSAGDPGRVRLAKQMIIWAIIGLAVILSAKFLQGVVSGIITGS